MNSPIEPNLRRLKTFAGVVQWGSVRRAAAHLHLTQPAVSRAVQKLEEALGQPLFKRTPGGMTITEFGQAVFRRTQRAFAHLESAELELATQPDRRRGAIACLRHAVTHRHLQALIATADCGTQSAAATRLGLSQPAITQAIGDLEQLAGGPLLLRAAGGMTATPAGEVILRFGKLCLAEINAMRSDLDELSGIIAGRVMVGVLPLAATRLVPRAVDRLMAVYPDLKITLVDGPYNTLLHALRCGELDVIVGPLRTPCPAADIVQEPLFDGSLSVVVRKHHPLTRRRRPTLADLRYWPWVIPMRGTPARMMIEQVMRSAGLDMPANPIETNELATLRALLMESDRVTIISREQIYFEESKGLLNVLPIPLGVVRPIGMTVRTDAAPSTGVASLLRHLREVSRDPLLARNVREPPGHSR